MIDRNILYKDYKKFFAENGSAVMRLTPVAAMNVCLHAYMFSTRILRIEGGIWREPGFEARMDCIWDSADDSHSTELKLNNDLAALFIKDECIKHNAFIITSEIQQQCIAC